jgi:hypothetical protein
MSTLNRNFVVKNGLEVGTSASVAATLDVTMSVPGTATTTTATTGGTLAASTYFYRITALDANSNEGLGSVQSTGQLTTGSTSTITLTFAPVPGAHSYRVYRTTVSGTYTAGYLAVALSALTISGTNYQFIDTGAALTAATLPTTTNARFLNANNTANAVNYFGPITIRAQSNVGILTLSPDATFAVTGTANVSGNTRIGGSLTVGTALNVGTAFIANATQVTIPAGVLLSANGGVGTAGQVLHSNGSAGSPYWAADDGSVTSVTAANGLSGGTITTTGTISVTANAPIVANASGVHITAATTGAAGSMSSADKTKLDGIATGAQVGTVTNVATGNGLSGGPITGSGTISVSANAPIVANASGVHITAANSTSAGSMSSTDKTKLDGIANGAQVGTVTSVGSGNGLTGGTISTSGTLSVTANAPIVANTTGVHITAANTTSAGSMSSADKTKLDGIAAGAQPGTVTSVSGTSPVASSGGTTPAISLAANYGDTLNPYASKTAKFVLAAPNAADGVPTFRAIVASDIPTLNQSTTGTASNVTGTVAIINGGTGATSRQDAMDALAGAVTSGQYLRGNGTDVVMSAIQAADVPTLNQSTTGSAATFTSTTQNSQFNSIGVGTAASATAGEIRATNNITAFFSSDKRFKQNVKDIENASDIVSRIGGKTFDWTEDYIEDKGGADGYFVKKQDFGVIAQDVQDAFPLAVREREDGTLAVDYSKLCALAFAAIKEQQRQIDNLKLLINNKNDS